MCYPDKSLSMVIFCRLLETLHPAGGGDGVLSDGAAA